MRTISDEIAEAAKLFSFVAADRALIGMIEKIADICAINVSPYLQTVHQGFRRRIF